MIRVVRTTDGVGIDPTGKANGRGAYLHELASCWQAGLRGNLEHALRVRLSPSDRQALEEHLNGLPEDPPHGSR
ncbi:MAG: YlxR family protein [Anaerolineales bacterium]|nr:YlxR family protein [Anaerolineales bacterium]